LGRRKLNRKKRLTRKRGHKTWPPKLRGVIQEEEIVIKPLETNITLVLNETNMKEQMKKEQESKRLPMLSRQRPKLNQTDSAIILHQYEIAVGKDSLRARNLIKKLDYSENPHLLAKIAQTYYDECRIESDGIPREFINYRKWRMAESYIIKAFCINSDLIDVLWLMGRIRQINLQYDIAIYCFEKLISKGQNPPSVSIAN
jgi:hypothetical protein